jgi:enhancing lycopene biosynthesis protein 2
LDLNQSLPDQESETTKGIMHEKHYYVRYKQGKPKGEQVANISWGDVVTLIGKTGIGGIRNILYYEGKGAKCEIDRADLFALWKAVEYRTKTKP